MHKAIPKGRKAVLDKYIIRIVRMMESKDFSESLILALPLMKDELVRFGVSNIEVWLKELERGLSNHENYLDIWIQGWFARVFAFNQFKVTMNPGEPKGLTF